ncbi:MAG: fructosamine kinase family protein [Bdellovibrionales bacterium]|nr:fructosamine kinase family protein [Bdellovibrionales bacterium]
MSGKLSDLKKRITSSERVSGGSMAAVEKVTVEGIETQCLLKTGYPSAQVYRAEAKGLIRLGLSKTFRVPEVIEIGDTYLLIEYVELGEKNDDFWQQFADKLVQMHNYSEQWYGFSSDNYCGLSLQKNTPPIPYNRDNAWAHFFVDYRLGQQTHLAKANRKWTTELNRLFQQARPIMFEILQDLDEPPSLLHGDLWSGNYLVDSEGAPVLIDPAAYYGHRETDLAMMKLFGGFPDEVFVNYEKAYSLHQGWELRLPIYQLYHQLNHLNLFGMSYEKAVSGTLTKILEKS